MKNLELECLTSWRFCRIPRGQKGPRYAGWQTEYLTLDQIGEGHNVGVILGAASGGVAVAKPQTFGWAETPHLIEFVHFASLM